MLNFISNVKDGYNGIYVFTRNLYFYSINFYTTNIAPYLQNEPLPIQHHNDIMDEGFVLTPEFLKKKSEISLVADNASLPMEN